MDVPINHGRRQRVDSGVPPINPSNTWQGLATARHKGWMGFGEIWGPKLTDSWCHFLHTKNHWLYVIYTFIYHRYVYIYIHISYHINTYQIIA